MEAKRIRLIWKPEMRKGEWKEPPVAGQLFRIVQEDYRVTFFEDLVSVVYTVEKVEDV